MCVCVCVYVCVCVCDCEDISGMLMLWLSNYVRVCIYMCVYLDVYAFSADGSDEYDNVCKLPYNIPDPIALHGTMWNGQTA